MIEYYQKYIESIYIIYHIYIYIYIKYIIYTYICTYVSNLKLSEMINSTVRSPKPELRPFWDDSLYKLMVKSARLT